MNLGLLVLIESKKDMTEHLFPIFLKQNKKRSPSCCCNGFYFEFQSFGWKNTRRLHFQGSSKLKLVLQTHKTCYCFHFDPNFLIVWLGSNFFLYHKIKLKLIRKFQEKKNVFKKTNKKFIKKILIFSLDWGKAILYAS